ncbi:hypothetical protein OTK49_21680 [Vibrio coralliirubri]|uniref:hypothetical protein n=1 Tax=Vibrio coralliirubri TaxID=1516159 RepID=UPI0022835E6F|nr:hypothetical protein [Vibrio coralliirubri]MCY9865134.1 hypothetical protein [Vibrio coralliirubri]
MYTTGDKKYVLFPCFGAGLNEGRIYAPTTSLNEDDAANFSKLITECTYFNEIARFANITNDDNKSKEYLKEYFRELKNANSDKSIYMERQPLNIPLIKSVHSQLTHAMNKK